jgi:hypothetical protein
MWARVSLSMFEFHSNIDIKPISVTIILAYLVIVLVCIILNAPLVDNPNRAGMLT